MSVGRPAGISLNSLASRSPDGDNDTFYVEKNWEKLKKKRFTSANTEGQVVPDKNIVLSKVSWRPIASIFAKVSAAFLTDHNSTIHRTNQQHTTPHFHKLRWAVSSQVNQLLNFLVKNHIFNIVTFCAHYNNNFIEFLIVYLTNWCWTPYKKSCWLKLWLGTLGSGQFYNAVQSF